MHSKCVESNTTATCVWHVLSKMTNSKYVLQLLLDSYKWVWSSRGGGGGAIVLQHSWEKPSFHHQREFWTNMTEYKHDTKTIRLDWMWFIIQQWSLDVLEPLMASAQSGNPIRPLPDQLYLLQINSSHCLKSPLRQLVETNCYNIWNETMMIITFLCL